MNSRLRRGGLGGLRIPENRRSTPAARIGRIATFVSLFPEPPARRYSGGRRRTGQARASPPRAPSEAASTATTTDLPQAGIRFSGSSCAARALRGTRLFCQHAGHRRLQVQALRPNTHEAGRPQLLGSGPANSSGRLSVRACAPRLGDDRQAATRAHQTANVLSRCSGSGHIPKLLTTKTLSNTPSSADRSAANPSPSSTRPSLMAVRLRRVA